MLQAVQQGMEEGLMSLREDMQVSQQQITQQFAQYQVHALYAHASLKEAVMVLPLRADTGILPKGRIPHVSVLYLTAYPIATAKLGVAC